MNMDFSSNYDIVVTGAGIAGVAAALAAGRRGHRVALIEKQTLVGGLATSGLIYVYLPLCDGEGTQVTFGIAEEILRSGLEFSPFDLSRKWTGSGKSHRPSDRFEVEFAPAALTLALDELLAKAGVDIWLDTRVCAVRQRSSRVTAIEVENTSGRGLIRGGCFVDASGEAIVIRRAGGDVASDINSLSFWMMEMSPKAHEVYPFTDSLHIKPFKFTADNYQPGSGLSGKAVTSYTRSCWREVRKYYRNSYAEGASNRFNHYPVHLPGMPQFRKIAAAKCLTMLDTNDQCRRFEDSVGMTGDWRKSGPVWETPFRSLIPEKVEGVFVAGRCMGTLGHAWEVYRVIPSAAMTGEAAGLAAALCVEKRRSTHELPASAVQEVLRNQGTKLHLQEVGLAGKCIH